MSTTWNSRNWQEFIVNQCRSLACLEDPVVFTLSLLIVSHCPENLQIPILGSTSMVPYTCKGES